MCSSRMYSTNARLLNSLLYLQILVTILITLEAKRLVGVSLLHSSPTRWHMYVLCNILMMGREMYFISISKLYGMHCVTQCNRNVHRENRHNIMLCKLWKLNKVRVYARTGQYLGYVMTPQYYDEVISVLVTCIAKIFQITCHDSSYLWYEWISQCILSLNHNIRKFHIICHLYIISWYTVYYTSLICII